jgi:hypothetical protein
MINGRVEMESDGVMSSTVWWCVYGNTVPLVSEFHLVLYPSSSNADASVIDQGLDMVSAANEITTGIRRQLTILFADYDKALVEDCWASTPTLLPTYSKQASFDS